MIEIKKIKKMPLANVSALFHSAAAFALGAGFYGYVLVAAVKTGQTAEPLSKFIWFNIGVGLLSAIFIAFFSGLVGWLMGFLAAGLYNIFAKRSGGLRLEVDGLVQSSPPPDKQERLFPF